MITAPRRWFQEPYVWLLIAIPLSSVLMGIVMIWLAVKNEDSLVVDDYYKRGLEINRTLARDDTAKKFALKSEMGFVEATGQIYAALTANANFTYPEALQLGFYHATKTGVDQEVGLMRTSDRAYSGRLPELIPGRWHVHLSADAWRLTGIVLWPAESSSFQLVVGPQTD